MGTWCEGGDQNALELIRGALESHFRPVEEGSKVRRGAVVEGMVGNKSRTLIMGPVTVKRAEQLKGPSTHHWRKTKAREHACT